MSTASRRVVITGGGGFVGQWMARALLERGDQVWLAGQGEKPAASAILSPSEMSAIQWLEADVRNDKQMAQLYETGRPELVVHLAAISHVPDAEGAPAAAFDVNVVGAVRLLSAAITARGKGVCDPLMLVVGSGTQYGDHPASEQPLPETAVQRPVSVYAASKLAQEVVALQIARTTGLRVICTRSFSHSGVGHGRVFLLPSLVTRVRELAKKSGAIRIGNDVVRDYLHVDDAVAGYLALADHGVAGEVYNLCSGVGISVRELATAALDAGGVKADIISDPSLRRGADMSVLIGSPARLIAATKWRPTKGYRDILTDLFAAD